MSQHIFKAIVSITEVTILVSNKSKRNNLRGSVFLKMLFFSSSKKRVGPSQTRSKQTLESELVYLGIPQIFQSCSKIKNKFLFATFCKNKLIFCRNSE